MIDVIGRRGPLSSALAILLLSNPTAVSPQATPTSGRSVMERFEAQERTEDTEMTLDMTLVDRKGRERHRSLSILTKTRPDGTRMQLIRFLDPADVEGTGFLSLENRDRQDDAWLYLPALRRTRRIAGSDKRDRFVGTDFTFEDLEPEALDEHRYRLLREDEAAGIATWVVEAVPGDAVQGEPSGYGHRELWISKDHAVLVEARLYDRDGAYVRRLLAEDIRQVPGTSKQRPHRITMESVPDGSRTVLDISEYRIDRGLDDSLFTERYLRRRRE